MPQGDFLNFSSTAWATGLSFVLGYFVFVGVWLPRLGLTLAARAWVTHGGGPVGGATPVGSTPSVGFTRFTLATGLIAPAGGVWPEIFLFGVEFAGLLAVVSTLAVPRGVYPLTRVVSPPREVVTPTGVTYAVANLLGLWAAHRGGVGIAAAAAVHEVTTRAATVVTPPTPVVLPRLKMAATPTRID
jgi:hypothetical protein